MDASLSFQEIIELKELKKDTVVTRAIIEYAKKLLELDEDEGVHLKQLMTQMRQAYTRMFESVKHCRLLTVKKEKLLNSTDFLLKKVLKCAGHVIKL